MRWSYEGVDFEPGGGDHSSPGSSYTVGQQIVQKVYGGHPPFFVGYAFVGMGGRSKISSSEGTNATVTAGLDIIEPAILRWLYARRANNQAFDIDFGQGLLRLYDEWDALLRQVEKGSVNEVNKRAFERATRTTSGTVDYTHQPVPFHLLASVLDVTQANEEQVLRIASQHLPEGQNLASLRAQLEPRFTCALNWVMNYLPDDERTHIRTSFHIEAYAALSAMDKTSLHLLVSQMDDHWTLNELTDLVYRIPKVVRGLPADAPPTDELKQAQRSFFVALYTLICDSDTGPRIPTLLLSLGLQKAKTLLAPPSEAPNADWHYELSQR
jgi:lysyl-tRNA synthetase class 1